MFDAWSEPFDPLRQGAAWRQVYALTEFILSGETTTPVPEIQRMLNRQATYSGWLYELIDIPYYDEYGVNAAWMQFLFDKSDLAAEGPPRAYPQEAVTLVCRPQDGSSSADFVRYDLAAMAASETTTLSGRDFFPLPDGRIAATQQLPTGAVALMVLDGNAEPINVALPVDPARHATVVSSYTATGSLVLLHDDLTSPDVVRFSLLDPARCSAESCQAAALPGRISMSPDGLHALAFVPDQEIGVSRTQLLGADLAPIRELGNAWDGGWFDNESYYIVTVDAVLAGRLGESDAQTLLDTAQLRERAPRGAVPLDEKTIFSSAVVNPDNPRQMLVAYTAINREAQVYQSQLLALDLADGEITVDPFPLSGSEEEPPVESYFIQVETHGPWIELLSYSPLTSSYMGTIQILDWQGNVANTLTTQGFNNYAGLQWSPDNEWLIVMDRRWTRIMAVGTEFQRLIFRGNDDGCFGAYWAPLETGGADS